MNQIRVLAGALPSFERQLRTYMAEQVDIHLVECVANGVQLAEVIQCTSADVVVAELIMPGLDALGVLERVNRLDCQHMPKFLVITPTGREAVIRSLLEGGADYCLLMPFEMEVLGARIRQLVSIQAHRVQPLVVGPLSMATFDPLVVHSSQGETIESRTARMLAEIGVSDRLNGFRFLCRSIVMVVENEDLLGRITKEVYPTVAREFGSSPSRVERSMRHAIETAWSRGNQRLLEGLFGPIQRRGRPPNSEFVAMIADRLREPAI